jgi:hypothetical protein
MSHPRMYADSDPLLAKVRTVCLALPESSEVEAWGRPTFRAGKKIFALFDSDGEADQSVIFKPEADERPALLADDRFFSPPYWGPSGWLALRLTTGPVDWTEVAELVEGSYRQVALVRMIKALDSDH